jgi:hypothetical protein
MRAFTALYRAYNDIDIYVEDRSLIGLYERLFGRILRGVARITSVTPLDGRSAVIAEAKRLQGDKTRRRFFLVDGDFFWILGPRQRVRGLYTLKCYSLENMAFERLPILNVAYIHAPQLTKAAIDAAFSDERFAGATKSLLPLFQVYAICHVLKAGCKTVDFSVHRLFENPNSNLLSAAAIRSRMRGVIGELLGNFTWKEILAAKAQVRSALDNANAYDSRFISGKSYLGALLLKWFQREVHYRGNLAQLTCAILDNSSVQIDRNLQRAVRRAARA